MSNRPGTVVVVGGGVVGISCALYIQRQGLEVTLVDREEPGHDGGASFGNAGSLSWTSCTPVAVPGLLAKVPGWLLRSDGPLTIRWRHLPTLAPWLWRFVRAGKLEAVEEAAKALSALHSPGLELHRELAKDAGVAELVRDCGYLHIFRDTKPDRLNDLEYRLRARHGGRLELLDSDALHEIEPELSPRYVQAVHICDQGFAANPSRLISAYAKLFVSRGGTVLKANVVGFTHARGHVQAVGLESGPIAADVTVIAAGPWSNRLTRMLGVDLPLETERGYHVTLADAGVRTHNTVMETTAKFVATPMETGLRLAGTVELASVDAAPDYTRADQILEHGRQMFPNLQPKSVSKWMGRRPSLPDGLPVIGPAPGFENVYLAFGHAHTGMIGGPNTGRLIAGMVSGQPMNIDVRPFRAARFLGG